MNNRMRQKKDLLPVKYRAPLNTALVGLLISPAAMAQTTPQVPATPPAQTTTGATPPEPGAAGAPASTLPQVTVKGSRPSEDFNDQRNSFSKLPAELRDIPQSVTIIDKALMQSQGATSLTSALRNVPGLTVGAAEGGTIGTNINLNGFSARTDIYLDGMRDRGQYYRDTFALESIEVLMGPSSMLFGRGSTGGVINQVLKKPSLKDAGEVSVSATTNGLVRTTADINKPIDETSAGRVAVMFQQGAVSTRDQNDVLDFGIAPSYKFGIGTPTEVTVYALIQHNHDQVDYGVPPLNGFPADVPRNTAYGYDSDYTDSTVIMLGSEIQHKFNKDLVLRNQTQFNYVNTNVRETAPQGIGTVGPTGVFSPVSYFGQTYSGLPLSNLFVRQQSHDRVIYDTSIYNDTELNANFNTGFLHHNLLLGLEFGFESYNNNQTQRNGTCIGAPMQAATATSGYNGCTPLMQPNNSAPGYLVSTQGNVAAANAQDYAGYFNDTIDIGPYFKLVGGLRYDIYQANISNSFNSTTVPGNTTLPGMSQTVNFLSVRGGAIVQPTNWMSYYASYSTSFNPSLEQLVSTTGTSQPLPPENNEAFEVGAKLDFFSGNLSWTGALFQITKYNARSQNPDGTFSATGTVRVQGARTGISGHLTDQWQVFGGFTYLNARIINGVAAGTQNMIPINTPTYSAVLWSTYAITPEIELGGGVQYMGQRYANNTNTVQAPQFFRFDAMAAYHFPTFDVRLNVFNLTDVKYYDQLMASDGGRAVPGSGRTAMLTVTKRF
jgi:catecholate siderophore receptor